MHQKNPIMHPQLLKTVPAHNDPNALTECQLILNNRHTHARARVQPSRHPHQNTPINNASQSSQEMNQIGPPGALPSTSSRALLKRSPMILTGLHSLSSPRMRFAAMTA